MAGKMLSTKKTTPETAQPNATLGAEPPKFDRSEPMGGWGAYPPETYDKPEKEH